MRLLLSFFWSESCANCCCYLLITSPSPAFSCACINNTQNIVLMHTYTLIHTHTYIHTCISLPQSMCRCTATLRCRTLLPTSTSLARWWRSPKLATTRPGTSMPCAYDTETRIRSHTQKHANADTYLRTSNLDGKSFLAELSDPVAGQIDQQATAWSRAEAWRQFSFSVSTRSRACPTVQNPRANRTQTSDPTHACSRARQAKKWGVLLASTFTSILTLATT